MSDHPIRTFVALFVIGITITAADISSFIKEVVPLVTALGVIYGIYVAAKAARTVKEASATVIAQQANIGDTTKATLTEIGETTKTTLGHVNSAASKAQATIEALLEKIALLTHVAAENKEIAAKLAQSVELAAAYATVPHAPLQTGGSDATLKSIDSNTAAIDVNTKKTVDDVQALKEKL